MLFISGDSITVAAENDFLRGRDGVFDITAGNDGVKSYAEKQPTGFRKTKPPAKPEVLTIYQSPASRIQWLYTGGRSER